MHTSDNEQMQMIKDWWKQYGSYILFVIVMLFVVNFSWRYWKQYKYKHLERSSMTYTQMLTAVDQQKNDEAKLYAQQLVQDYPKSSYASLAALILAKFAVQTGDLKLAQEHLQFVIKKSSAQVLRQIARLRAARILLSLKQPQIALDLLATVDDKAYMAAINEVSGDAWVELGNFDKAKQAYQRAMNLEVQGSMSPLLHLKMQQF